MKLSAITIEKLSEIILGENQTPTYKSGLKLVKFFNDFFNNKDFYGPGFPSRKDYAQKKTRKVK